MQAAPFRLDDTGNAQAPESLPCTDDVLDVSVNPESVIGMIDALGSISDVGILASDCTASGPGLSYAILGAAGTFTIWPAVSNSLSCNSTKLPFVVDVGMRSCDKIRGKVKRMSDESYRVVYPCGSGLGDRIVSITLYGSHINGSPFVVPYFFERFENLAMDGKFIHKTSSNGWDSWAESQSLQGSDRLKFTLRVEICDPYVPGFQVSFQDDQSSCSDCKNSLSSRAGVLSTNRVCCGEALECFVDFKAKLCGIGNTVSPWRGFIKLCVFLYHKGNRFYIDL